MVVEVAVGIVVVVVVIVIVAVVAWDALGLEVLSWNTAMGVWLGVLHICGCIEPTLQDRGQEPPLGSDQVRLACEVPKIKSDVKQAILGLMLALSFPLS